MYKLEIYERLVKMTSQMLFPIIFNFKAGSQALLKRSDLQNQMIKKESIF